MNSPTSKAWLPFFKVTANDKDITQKIVDRLVSLQLTDETGFNSDTLEIVLSDTVEAYPIQIPPTGAELQLWLGSEGGNRVPKGTFICDEVELNMWPGTLTLRARAAPFAGHPLAMVELQSQKSRSWPVGTTIGAMVGKMAAEHGMKSVTSQELADVELPHIDQTAESDMHFLVRLARRYDAIAKAGGGNLIFAKRGNSTTVSGIAMPSITLKRDDVSGVRMLQARRDSAGTVVAFYRDMRTATRHQVTAGSGEPVRHLRFGFKDQSMATAAVKAELAKRARAEHKLSISMVGRPDMTAEATLSMDDFREGIKGDWLVTQVTHNIDARGYTCTVEAEKPNDDPSVQDAFK
jgi:phage protein D